MHETVALVTLRQLAQASVEDIIVSGRMRIILKPLLVRLPVVGALQVPVLVLSAEQQPDACHHFVASLLTLGGEARALSRMLLGCAHAPSYRSGCRACASALSDPC